MNRVISETRIPIKIWASLLEEEAEAQMRKVADLPFVFRHVAVMPDAHAGKGSTVGTVIATRGAIIPATVGVDIGCGMAAMKLPYKIDDFSDLPKLRNSIERAVPNGRYTNNHVTDSAKLRWQGLGAVTDTVMDKMRKGVFEKSIYSLGSLGGGNHFIEICGDKDNGAWIMLHSGSRNIGKCMAEIHINRAKDIMKQYFITPPNDDLSYLVQETPEFNAYIHDLHWGQRFAQANREEMLDRVLREVLYHLGHLDKYNVLKESLFRVNCHHNYTQMENHFGSNVWVTRKGAVSAKKDEWGIIPGSMGAKSFIVRGRGNAESFCSCSHGAGRKMSRTRAKQLFTVEDVAAQTIGVECRKDKEVIDEIPGAYKDIDIVMADQADLVTPVYELKQILCVKGAD